MVRELITNSTIGFADEIKPSVLIMDEVDGMSSGDRGGVAELISLIKITKIPIICICNDRYSTKLKSLYPTARLLFIDQCVHSLSSTLVRLHEKNICRSQTKR